MTQKRADVISLLSNKRLGVLIGLAGLMGIYVCSLYPVAGLLIKPLQTQYKRFNLTNTSASYIVVLGGWHKSNKLIPLTSQLSRESLLRLVEAATLYHQQTNAKLILSGAKPENDPNSNAYMMGQLALKLGVPSEDVILEERPTNTEEEAAYLKEYLKGQQFILITSASHMQRAVKLFKQQGLFPIPVPVDFLLLGKVPFSLTPSAIALHNSDKALHEYLGLVWVWLGKIGT